MKPVRIVVCISLALLVAVNGLHPRQHAAPPSQPQSSQPQSGNPNHRYDAILHRGAKFRTA